MASVFHEGDVSRHGRISIGHADGVDQLEIDVVPPGDESFERIAASLPEMVHDVLCDFWRMVLRTAQDNNVQVIATTHGWDCVRGFAQAATELEDVEGVLVRLEREEDSRTRAVEYPEGKLMAAARHGIEVR